MLPETLRKAAQQRCAAEMLRGHLIFVLKHFAHNEIACANSTPRWRPSAAWPLVAAFVTASLAALSPLPAQAQEAPTTIWQMLGIGADQYSDNPAIKAAAKAKAAKHEICKKKRALEYLAGMGCSPEHPEVGPALIAAMGDPDEPVRYAAVKAVLQTAGDCQSKEQKRSTRKALGCVESCHDYKKKVEKAVCDCIDRIFGKAPPKEHVCKKKLEECCENLKNMLTGNKPCPDPTKQDCPCGNGHGPCCSEDMKKKLQELACGRDENGCFLEPSERVRTVAELALKACASCNGECFGGRFYDSVVRELPPVVERELPPSDTSDACVADRAIISVPEPQHRLPDQPTPATQPLFLPAEPLPPPPPSPREKSAARTVRSVLVDSVPASVPPRDDPRTRRPPWSKPHRFLTRQRDLPRNPPWHTEMWSKQAAQPQVDSHQFGIASEETPHAPQLGQSRLQQQTAPTNEQPARWASTAALPQAALPASLPIRKHNVKSPSQNSRSSLAQTPHAPSGRATQPAQSPIQTKANSTAGSMPTPSALIASNATTTETTTAAHRDNPAKAQTTRPPQHKPQSIYLLRLVAILITAALVFRIAMALIPPEYGPRSRRRHHTEGDQNACCEGSTPATAATNTWSA